MVLWFWGLGFGGQGVFDDVDVEGLGAWVLRVWGFRELAYWCVRGAVGE